MIEVLLTLGVLSLISTVALTIFQETMATYQKANNMLELESNGGYVLSLLEEKIRSAQAVLAYKDYDSCTEGCASSWLLLVPAHKTVSVACIYLGHVHDSGGDPDLWPNNGYVFLQEGTSAQCTALNPAEDLDGSLLDSWQTAALSNRNQDDPFNGVNVSSLVFMIAQQVGNDPATVGIALDLKQGVSGNPLTVVPENKKASLHLETTVSLR